VSNLASDYRLSQSRLEDECRTPLTPLCLLTASKRIHLTRPDLVKHISGCLGHQTIGEYAKIELLRQYSLISRDGSASLNRG
jgi:hypothetical protein